MDNEENTDYEIGYYQCAQDIFIIFLKLTYMNAKDIQEKMKEIKKLLEK